ncbi:hypothetical protein ACTHPH_21750 [Paenibacillus pasadenensis]|uniref:hypothetical protein n=1 Tax=Paenibacillus pasadenensis TaxID=217090 RepID=UPI0003F9EDA8|nr:hypothetical protein [Paenibacillus pasadenensis]
MANNEARLYQPALVKPAVQFRNDCVVHRQEDGLPIYLSQVLELIFGERLTQRPRRPFEKGRPLASAVAPGWVHLGVDKSDLVSQRQTTFVRTYSTFLHYVQKGYGYMTYGTFKSKSRRSSDRNRRALNSTHALVVDIDSKSMTADEILDRLSQESFLPPTFINETNRGYHVWYVLSAPIVGPHERVEDGKQLVTKAGQFYMDMSKFLNAQFIRMFPGAAGGVDDLVGGERYIRIPTSLSYYSGHTYSILDFPHVRKDLYDDGKIPVQSKKAIAAVKWSKGGRSGVSINRGSAFADPAYVKLMTMQPQEGHRRYTAFTIALLHYAVGLAKGEATSWLAGWYERLLNRKGLSWREVQAAVDMAYSGKYKGPHQKWMMTLTGMKATTYITRKKSEDERVYKTVSHWQRLFLHTLAAAGGSRASSVREWIVLLEMTSHAMFEAMVSDLIQNGIIKKSVEGKGRTSCTRFELVSPLSPDKQDESLDELSNCYEVADNVIPFELRSMTLPRNSSIIVPDSPMLFTKSNRVGGRGVPWDASPDSS